LSCRRSGPSSPIRSAFGICPLRSA
jgi:hypothetical protein